MPEQSQTHLCRQLLQTREIETGKSFNAAPSDCGRPTLERVTHRQTIETLRIVHVFRTQDFAPGFLSGNDD